MQASQIVCEFLRALEERDLEKAKSYVSSEFSMIFPGGVCFKVFEELMEWSKPRYQNVKKKFECFDEISSVESTIVYCQGTLSGRWPGGNEFDDIRFVDRFIIENSKIVKQEVWNDLAEVRTGKTQR